MAFIGPLEDRLAIRERIDAYADCVCRHDGEAWAECWAEDAVWDLGRGEVHGKAAVFEAWKAAMANFRFVAFLTWMGEIKVDGETATARSQTQEVLFPHAGGERRIFGRYEDILVKRGGVWLFRERRYTFLHDKEG
jgi:ketosteroid isomerase-like protein